MFKKIIIIVLIVCSLFLYFWNKKENLNIFEDDSHFNENTKDYFNKESFELNFFQSGKYGSTAHKLTINNLEVHYFRDYPEYAKLDKNFLITKEDRDEIINKIQNINFFELKDKYDQLNCLDGLVMKWKVILNKDEKEIYLYFCEYPDQEKITEKLSDEILSVLDKYLKIQN